jgi:hypothetical protein
MSSLKLGLASKNELNMIAKDTTSTFARTPESSEVRNSSMIFFKSLDIRPFFEYDYRRVKENWRYQVLFAILLFRGVQI